MVRRAQASDATLATVHWWDICKAASATRYPALRWGNEICGGVEAAVGASLKPGESPPKWHSQHSQTLPANTLALFEPRFADALLQVSSRCETIAFCACNGIALACSQAVDNAISAQNGAVLFRYDALVAGYAAIGIDFTYFRLSDKDYSTVQRKVCLIYCCCVFFFFFFSFCAMLINIFIHESFLVTNPPPIGV